MSTRILSLMLAVCFAAGPIAGQGPSAKASNATLMGVWRGDLEGLPGIALIVTDEGGTLVGAAQFYFHFRPDVNHPWTSTPGLPEPMLNPKFDGTTLTFQISHRRAHPPGSLNDPPVSFHLRLLGPDKAELQNEKEGPPLVITRSDY